MRGGGSSPGQTISAAWTALRERHKRRQQGKAWWCPGPHQRILGAEEHRLGAGGHQCLADLLRQKYRHGAGGGGLELAAERCGRCAGQRRRGQQQPGQTAPGDEAQP